MKTYKIQISEEQRQFLLVALRKLPISSETQTRLYADLYHLPDDQDIGDENGVVNLITEE